MRCPSALPCLILALGALGAGEATPEPGKPGKQTQPKRLTAMQLIAEEEKWIFRAPVGREDVMIDKEAQLIAIAKGPGNAPPPKPPGPGGTERPGDPTTSEPDQILAWAKAEEERVRQAAAARRWDEGLKTADAALKTLEPHIAKPAVAAVVVSIRTYRGQIEEAKIRDDAQAAFEGLKIQVLGVLWSQDGMRLAIIQGENRALAVNDRVKDCPVINIDQDRVDFRFVYGRRRFEFPVYVDQSAGGKK